MYGRAKPLLRGWFHAFAAVGSVAVTIGLLLRTSDDFPRLVADPDKFEAMVDEISRKLASGAPLAQKLTKAMFYYGAQADQRTGAFIESEASAAICFTKDISEGITSMYSRRAPKFKGQ